MSFKSVIKTGILLAIIVLNYFCPLSFLPSAEGAVSFHPSSESSSDNELSSSLASSSVASSSLSKRQTESSSSPASEAQCECEYYRLEGYYIWHNFTQHTNYTHRQIHLNPSGRLQYRCLLTIPKCQNSKLLHVSGRSSRIPEIFTAEDDTDNVDNRNRQKMKPSRNFCEGLQIAIEMPFTSTGNENVTEEAHLETENRKPDREVYVVWLNITNFDTSIQGDYWFYAKQPSSDNVLCRHRLTMTVHRLKKDAHPPQPPLKSSENSTDEIAESSVESQQTSESYSTNRKRHQEAIVLVVLCAILISVIVTFFAFQNRLRALLPNQAPTANSAESGVLRTKTSEPDIGSKTTTAAPLSPVKTTTSSSSSKHNESHENQPHIPTIQCVNNENSQQKSLEKSLLTFKKEFPTQNETPNLLSLFKKHPIDPSENCYPL